MIFADRPFLVVHRAVVLGAQGDRVIDVGGTVIVPFDEVVNLAIDRRDSASWSLAAAVAGQDGPALGWCEEPVGAVLG